MITKENPVIQDGNPTLRQIAIPIDFKKDQDELALTLKNMRTILNRFPDGVAIAAPQIDISKRIFILSHELFPKEKLPLVYINPYIVKTSKKTSFVEEGCLSVRGIFGFAKRYNQITIEAYDAHGVKFRRGVSGLIAQIYQHEIDHLNGILFCDHARDLAPYEVPEMRDQE